MVLGSAAIHMRWQFEKDDCPEPNPCSVLNVVYISGPIRRIGIIEVVNFLPTISTDRVIWNPSPAGWGDSAICSDAAKKSDRPRIVANEALKQPRAPIPNASCYILHLRIKKNMIHFNQIFVTKLQKPIYHIVLLAIVLMHQQVFVTKSLRLIGKCLRLNEIGIEYRCV